MNFQERYSAIKAVFERLPDVSEPEMQSIEYSAKRLSDSDSTNVSIVAIITAIVNLFILPLIISKALGYSDLLVSYLVSKKGHYESGFIELATASMGLGGFGIICYFFIFSAQPFRNNEFSVKYNNPFYRINTKERNFMLARITGGYLALLIILYIAQLHTEKYNKIIISIFSYYSLIPFVVALVIVSLFSTISILTLVLRLMNKRNNLHDIRVDLCIIFINALYRIKDDNKTLTMPKRKINAISIQLRKASHLIVRCADLLGVSAYNDSFKTLNQSADFVACIAMDLQTANDLSSAHIKHRLVECLTIALQGDLLKLPKIEVGVRAASSAEKVKIYRYILLAIYLAIPIICVFIINIVFKLTINEYNQSLLKILYLAWVFVGIFSNPIMLESENKELIRDIVKSWFGKG